MRVYDKIIRNTELRKKEYGTYISGKTAENVLFEGLPLMEGTPCNIRIMVEEIPRNDAILQRNDFAGKSDLAGAKSDMIVCDEISTDKEETE